ncbi:MAG: ATP-binding cassette domain-containing protein [Turicibacter sp.]|nr:ATP-binding cassette domain-containing protein [Turicibacter sp.]
MKNLQEVTQQRIRKIMGSQILLQPGIHLLKGENGTGKTTLVESIVLAGINPKNPDDHMPFKGRNSTFAYFSQRMETYPCTVSSYLTKGHKKIDPKIIEEWFHGFELEHINLTDNFAKLSGGEKVKLSLIAIFLKESEIFFLDEPTNNLDNDSTRFLKKKLEELAVSKPIVVITHDTRLDCIFTSETELSETDIEIKSNHSDAAAVKANKETFNLKLWNIMSQFLFNFDSFALAFVSILLACFSIWQTNESLRFSLTNDTLTPPENVIIAYTVFGDFSMTENHFFSDYRNLTIAEDAFQNIIDYQNLEDIIMHPDVTHIHLQDEIRFDEITAMLWEENLLDELVMLSIPNTYTSGPELAVYNFSIQGLMRGRLPLDGANEVAISTAQLTTFFDYDESSAEASLGDEIFIQGDYFTIVGHSFDDIAFLSFNPKQPLGFYEFNESNLDELQDFSERMMEFKTSVNYWIPDSPNFVIVYAALDGEMVVLDYLISNFPGEHYYSYHFGRIFTAYWNREAMSRIWWTNLTFLLIPILTTTVFNIASFKNSHAKLKDFQNYYLSKKLIYYVFSGKTACHFFLVSIATLIFSSALHMDPSILPFILVNSLLLALPNLLYFLSLAIFRQLMTNK